MKLELKRFEYGSNFTIGRLYINDRIVCYTLEDKMREVDGEPVEKWKIKGDTAIPQGDYLLVMDYSNRFKKILPHILNVPGYEGVRIHTGNKSEDTEGCILVGTAWAGTNWISGSRNAFTALLSHLERAALLKESVQVSIKNF